MHRLGNLLTITSDLGDVFRVVAPLTAIPLVITVLYQEWNMILPMLAVPLVFFGLGILLSSVPRHERGLRLSTAMCTVALFWLCSAVISALPFILGLHMGFTDAVFEGMAGWTGTAFSMIISPDTAPHTLLFWRSFMQWIGGLGIIAFAITIASSTGLAQGRLFRTESRDEPLMPSVFATGRVLWKIYGVLTFVAVGLILFTGLSLWEAVNLALSAISTGGFTIHAAGIPYYHSAALELILIPIMIAGALPFKLYYLIIENRRLSFFGDEQVKMFFVFLAAGTAVLAYDLVFFSDMPLSGALEQGLFMAVSAITTTGFQTANLGTWASVTLLFLAMLIFIGGASGSTAGGIKLSRIALAIRALHWWFQRLYVSGKVLLPFRIEGRVIPKATAELEAAKNMLVIIVSVLAVFVATMVIFQFTPLVGSTTEIVFTVVSAFSTCGLNTGAISPAMSLGAKWIFIVVMWVGRLEVIPVVIVFAALFRRPE